MARNQRLVFGEDAELYDRARPSYPAELIDDLVALAGTGSRALDAGCGTGKATVLLAARGFNGVGVEPDSAMARIARRQLSGFPGWRVDVSDFESWSQTAGEPPFGLLVSAQAWHWFEPATCFRKAYELLRPGGWLALWWNGPAAFDTPARRAIGAAYQAHAPEIAYRGVSGHGQPDFEPMPKGVYFRPPVERAYAWSNSYTASSWIDLLRSHSDHRMLPVEQREELLTAVARAIDANGGIYDHPYVCRLWAAQRQ
jgi:SAM-dependent methyltransferase